MTDAIIDTPAAPVADPAAPALTDPAAPATDPAAPVADPAADPADPATPAVDPKMTVPETPDGYTLPVPEGDDGAFAKTAAAWFHEAGIPPAQAEKLANKWNEFAKAQGETNAAAEAKAAADAEAQAEAKFKADDASLRKEWGDKYDANIELGKRAYREFGFTPDVVEAIEDKVGSAALFKLFANIGSKIGEDSALGVNSSTSPLTFQSAAAKMYGSNG